MCFDIQPIKNDKLIFIVVVIFWGVLMKEKFLYLLNLTEITNSHPKIVSRLARILCF